jgi:hypothetical protein
MSHLWNGVVFSKLVVAPLEALMFILHISYDCGDMIAGSGNLCR